MLRYTIKRFLQSLVTLFIVVTIVFVLMRLMPIEGFLGEGFDKLDPRQQEAILEQMGLNDPLHVQLKNFYVNLLTKGDLGVSTIYRPRVPVTEIIGPKIPYSLGLGLPALGLSLFWGLGLGVLMARFKNGFIDKLGTAYIVFVNAVPGIVYILFIQLYFSSWFKLPLLFRANRPESWFLPIICLSLGSVAGYAMWMRRYMVDELNKDYIRLARAKGMKNTSVMVKHVLRNAYVPMAQYLPATVLFVLAGSILIESLFSIPGMGGLLVHAIQRQDTPLVQALVLIFASFSIFGLFMGDILMALFDPRIKLEDKGGSR
jgi:oligopeptide transport system permease protein